MQGECSMREVDEISQWLLRGQAHYTLDPFYGWPGNIKESPFITLNQIPCLALDFSHWIFPALSTSYTLGSWTTS